MAGQKRLSLCMITRDDENNLSDCLQRLKGLADEIIIVDIGSRDQTIAIARKAGAQVYQMEFKNSYSEAKNLCLDKAQGRWVLFLQANETIPAEQLKELWTLLDNPNAEGYLLDIDCSENFRIASPVQSLRLFRNRKEYRYRYRSFPRIPDELLNNISDAGIRIVRQTVSPAANEPRALTSLLQEELAEHPEDSYLQYIYGMELINQKKYEESVSFLQMARQNVNLDYLFAPHLFKCLSWSLISLRRYPETLEVLEEGIRHFPFYTDLLVLRGELRKQLGQYGEAIRDLESSLKIMEQPNFMAPGPEVDIVIILKTLGEIHEEVFNYQQALACFNKSYELQGTEQTLLYKIGELEKEVDSPEILENFLMGAVKRHNIEQLLTVMDVLFRQREYAKVLAALEYLESFLGKGEQTESIKIICHMMLGEMKEAEFHFSAMDEDSPFYQQILMQRIVSLWSLSRWQEAECLILEMGQSAVAENHIKGIYHLLHGLLTGKDLRYPLLTEQEYEIVKAVLEDFLWFEQVEKARVLLALLLKSAKEEQCIVLAKLWAGQNDCQTIETILQHVSNKKKQLRFKQLLIVQLLRNEQLAAARKIAELGEKQPLGVPEYLMRSQSLLINVREWAEKVQRKTTAADRAAAADIKTKPNEALRSFYESLGIGGKNRKECGSGESNQELTTAKIHGEIADFYAKANKKKEALSAYLRALQWDPLEMYVQEKLKEFSLENHDIFAAYLEEDWVLEGGSFFDKKLFIFYVQGVICFKKQQFEEALVSFSQMNKEEAGYSLALSYIAACFWLTGKECEAEKSLNDSDRISEILPSFFLICKSYVLDLLQEGHMQFPYSRLITAERERVKNFTFP